ncbi:hypothetical protein HW555_000106 [Spodoptera exigua]|uniref:Uncharacterized protein n=1 Tax=Spodoptera exigua TaxID=7107 RepID=A0A835GSA6_SPOEX|nr:hypothetical protein HW555_000106 [Spodoptera exigua]
MGDTVTTVDYNTRKRTFGGCTRLPGRSERQHSLHSDIQTWHVPVPAELIIHTTPARASTIGRAKELTRKPIVMKTAVSMQGELPPALSVWRRAIIVDNIILDDHEEEIVFST